MPKKSQVEKQASLDLRELGITGLKRFGGQIFEEFLKELHGTRGLCIYREMRYNEPIIGGMLFVIEMMIRQTEFHIVAADQSNEGMQAKLFVESVLDDMSMSWNDTMSEILSMLPYGFAPHEMIWKRRNGESRNPVEHSKFSDGMIGWAKLPIRAQESVFEWIYNEEIDEPVGYVQVAETDGKRREIPMEKTLLFRTTSNKNSPEGMSVLRNVYRPWYFKKLIENLRGIGIERNLAGLPVAWVPARLLSTDASPEDKAAIQNIEKIVKNIKTDEQMGLVLPLEYDEHGNKLWDFQLLSAGGGQSGKSMDINETINSYDQRMALTLLTDFILLGHEKVGSFALASSKTRLFSAAIGAWMDAIASVFNRTGIPKLCKLNGIPPELYPRMNHGDIETVDLVELGDYISKLAGVGMPLFPDDKVEAYLKSQAGIPISQETDEL
jgi:hypothetical protein